MRYTLALGAALALVWWLWSGHADPLLLSLGAASVLFVLFISRRMGIADEETVPLYLPLRLPFYLPWLFWEITKANLDVARRILAPSLPIEPNMIRVRAGQRSDVCRVIYANSITLTPGTVSVDTAGDEITIHALTRPAAQGVESGEMDRRVRWLEGTR